MPQRTIRFSETTIKQIRQAARKKGFTSTAIVRHAVEQALSSSEEAVERLCVATPSRFGISRLRSGATGWSERHFGMLQGLNRARMRPFNPGGYPRILSQSR
jgi:hypothetical protein